LIGTCKTVVRQHVKGTDDGKVQQAFLGPSSSTQTKDFNTRPKVSRKVSKVFIKNRNGAKRFPMRLFPRKIPIHFNAGPTSNPLSGFFQFKTDNIHEAGIGKRLFLKVIQISNCQDWTYPVPLKVSENAN